MKLRMLPGEWFVEVPTSGAAQICNRDGIIIAEMSLSDVDEFVKAMNSEHAISVQLARVLNELIPDASVVGAASAALAAAKNAGINIEEPSKR